MIRTQESTGKTVDEARAKACALLGVQADDLNVSYEVLEMPQKTGFLGLKTRGELFPPEGPLPPLERIGGVDKARAVQMALRTLAPQVILLDELGSLEETMALEQGFFSGADFIASIHAPDAAQARCRPQVQALLQRGMLRQLVILAGRETPGCIQEVCAV